MALEYIRSNTQDESVIRKALNEKDLSLFPDAAHRIKGSAKMVGLIELADSATQLEAAVKGLQWEECVSAGERLLALMQIVKNDIGVWLNDK
ncbi:Hpt domain-containing protein [Aeromonas hydrophila]|nr:Hpt domain-containing protein [Aeromonas hydrophila]